MLHFFVLNHSSKTRDNEGKKPYYFLLSMRPLNLRLAFLFFLVTNTVLAGHISSKSFQEANAFTKLYILNKGNHEAENRYKAGEAKHSEGKISQRELDALKEDWSKKENALLDFARSSLGVSFRFQDPDVVRQSHTIAGVDTKVFYLGTKRYHNRPIFIYGHGDGAKNMMTLDRYDPLFFYLISNGYVVVAPNFRENREIEDLYSVSRETPKYLVNNLKDLSIDPSQQYLTSISAGSYLSFMMLEKIGKEKLFNPFKGVQLFSTIADITFKDRVQYLPSDIPYLIIHGDQDPPHIAPVDLMKEVYQEMKKQGFSVRAYFSPSGDHHLVDPKLNASTPETDPSYQDLLGWPLRMFAFFKQARTQVVASQAKLPGFREGLYERVFAKDITSNQEDEADLDTLDPELIPSLKYITMFNSAAGGVSTKLSTTEHLKKYFLNLHAIEGNQGWDQFYQKIEEIEFRRQIKRILIKEQEFHKQTERGVVAYHAASGDVTALYHLFSAFAAAKEVRKVGPMSFRGGKTLLENCKKRAWDLTSENPIDFLIRAAKPDQPSDPSLKPALNKDPKFAESTLSLNPFLFSGIIVTSSSIALWERSQSGGGHNFSAEKALDEFLSQFCLSLARKNEYKELLKRNVDNGGIFQFFAQDRNFDQISRLTEPLGAELPFSLTISKYEQTLRTNPESLKHQFLNKKYSNHLDLAIYSNPRQQDLLFSLVQIRIPASPEWTKRLNVEYYSHRPEAYTAFRDELERMVKEDVSKMNSRCQLESSWDASPLSPIVSSMNKMVALIEEFTGRTTLLTEAHRLVLEGNAEKLREFVNKYREDLRKNSEIIFENGKNIGQMIEETYASHDQFEKRIQMLKAVESTKPDLLIHIFRTVEHENPRVLKALLAENRVDLGHNDQIIFPDGKNIATIVGDKIQEPNLRKQMFEAIHDGTEGEALLNAASKGDLRKVRELLAQYVDPNYRTSDGGTALIMAAQNGHLEIVRVLSDQLTDALARENSEETILCFAVLGGHLLIVRQLLLQGVSPNLTKKDGTTVLYMAASNKHWDVVEELLRCGADPNWNGRNDGGAALFFAVKDGQVKIVEKLLKDRRVKVEFTDRDGFNVLHEAAYQSRLDVLDALLVNDRSDEIFRLTLEQNNCGWLPIHFVYSVTYRKDEMILKLASKNPNTIFIPTPEIRYQRNHVLHVAALQRNWTLVKSLIRVAREAGIKEEMILSANSRGQTLLHLAEGMNGDAETARLLRSERSGHSALPCLDSQVFFFPGQFLKFFKAKSLDFLY